MYKNSIVGHTRKSWKSYKIVFSLYRPGKFIEFCKKKGQKSWESHGILKRLFDLFLGECKMGALWLIFIPNIVIDCL